jgi:hypothetical protein
VSGVPRGLARHVGHDPPKRVPVAVDRDDETRFRVADGTDRAVAVLDCRPVVPQHVGRGAVGGDGHAVFPVGVPCGPDEVVAEPIPLRLGQVLDETKDGGAAVDQDAAQLLIRQPVGLLQHAVPGERQERQGRVELARVDAWHGLPLGLRHAATVTRRPDQTDGPPPPGRAGCRALLTGSMILAHAEAGLALTGRQALAPGRSQHLQLSAIMRRPMCSYPGDP